MHPDRRFMIWLVALMAPALALVLLLAVVLGGLDERLFFFFNGLSEVTGPTFWAYATFVGDGLVCRRPSRPGARPRESSAR